MDVSIRELKNHLSEYLRRVQAGEEITVTSRGRAVARLSAVIGREGRAESDEALAARVRALPGVRAALGKRVKLPERPLDWPGGGPSLSELILEDRD
ncbi:type II toxin-antitoxin system prevent-host-death family antitoxin [Gammaproteobacteria bacterium AB-CW1]|uniref:Antitoxin n=1 Tax=Natronospira elongata TaxID=3110268 RepID=A0AAP6JE29_9GAMM|nr:type II toxin-antitoxin system prevent-host-death family antitoxin [Gammaproteobacteria bacterium AB-CW1]